MPGSRGSEAERVQHLMGYRIDNNGVGPARVEWVEMRLLDACCKAPAVKFRPAQRGGK
ncbi:hypothetical protein SRABI118_02460 [Massilia sp. Bi118]|nr:hypothetical protein SRABI118_02460 [Massilia sp. Bi118]